MEMSEQDFQDSATAARPWPHPINATKDRGEKDKYVGTPVAEGEVMAESDQSPTADGKELRFDDNQEVKSAQDLGRDTRKKKQSSYRSAFRVTKKSQSK